MKLVTATQMKKIDEYAIGHLHISRATLMENAGKAVLRVLEGRYSDLSKKRVMVICGRGNNGGDGFVVARLLFQKKNPVCIYLADDREDLKHEAKSNFLACERLGVAIHYTKHAFKRHLCSIDLVIDGLFGTGIHSPLEKRYRDLIKVVNHSQADIISIDIPSGVDGSSGRIMGEAISAKATVTLGLPKLGLWVSPGMDHAGEVVIENIGLPKNLLQGRDPTTLELITEKDIEGRIPLRTKTSHKGSAGHALIIAGSPGKSGAAVMCVQSAFRSGIGLVTLLTHPKILTLIGSQVKEAFLDQLPERREFLNLFKNKNVIAIGPGIGFSEDVQWALQNILFRSRVPVVVDADALTILSQHMSWLKKIKCPVILTPHPGEMARLIGKKSSDVQKNRLECARQFAQKYRVYLILKGAGTIIATPQGQISINSSGNPSMATAGMGDVLTGMIASLISQGLELSDALHAAVYIHGWIADQWIKKTHADRGLMASDLTRLLPQAIFRFRSKTG